MPEERVSPAARPAGAAIPLPGFLGAVNAAGRDRSGRAYTREEVQDALAALSSRFASGSAIMCKAEAISPATGAALARGLAGFGPCWLFGRTPPNPAEPPFEGGVWAWCEGRIPEGSLDWPSSVARCIADPANPAVLLAPGSAFTLLGAWRIAAPTGRLAEPLLREVWGVEAFTESRR